MQPIGNILSELLARRGYARERSGNQCADAWQQAAGDAFGRSSRAGQVRRGVLEVIVSNSTMVQEISFQKQALLKRLAELVPDEKIEDLRFRVGPIE